ncbi:ABC transporter ATP-binding protein [Pseudomonas vancouverensis]|uniref:ABC transporter ATP-binding protein n=1 Tax=Pseudomonas vancouverensis TaxID=95300 RepID=A0A1H2NGP5_PSEVA|nr:ABC transporter ATP-binding protein [Pseudomonas vancouverensis]KAB0489382.1 ABC transporter ATP-binding protein [Pseudomonas vancouverensis]TDB60920.1 ABC transporter ATP-binding protein [Pseudomonas vancouverensis]SDV04649.1 peptide/nickel transport system ATP-binding protein [Pseudomonas vancouverensis]
MTNENHKHTPRETLLTITDLHIEAQSGGGWQEIVKGIDLELHRGEILGLIGESGAGKSTLGLAAMGFERPGCRITQGSIVFDGTDLTQAPQEDKLKLWGSRIAYVAQSAAAAFNPAHNLIDQYVETAVLHNVLSEEQARADAVEMYRRLRLPDPEQIGFRYPHQVSGGQLQRAMTAMAMACRPDLIIFDEPTTALDVTTQVEVLAAIRDVVEQFGTAAIYITHDLAVVAQMADRIMVLRHGNTVEEAETAQMLSAPQMDYTKTLWAVRELCHQPKTFAKAAPVLKLQGIQAGYGGLPILHDISLEVPKGATVAVVGESGSGKSTVARVLTGLLPASQGQLHFDGQVLPLDYRQRSRDTLRHIQMIYQMPDTALNPRQRVRDFLGRPLEFYLGLTGKAKEARIHQLLEQIELSPARIIDRYPGELSGGQKQRICIARALAAEPKVIICDEVTSALDQIVAKGILQLLERLQEQLGISYLFITHDIETVKGIADQVVVMHKGRIVEQGPIAQVFSPPHHDYTAKLLASVPQMDPEWLTRRLAERVPGTV